MKRKIICFLVIALSSMISLFSQTRSEVNGGYVNAFEADRAVWTYVYACGSGPYTLFKTILYGDTVVDGMEWKIVTGLFMDSGKGLVRTDTEKRVIYRGYPGYEYADEEIVIYDFSLNVGDSILVYYSTNHPPIKKEINLIDSIVLGDGKKHKQMQYHIHETNGVIEGVGLADFHPFYMLLHLPTCSSGPSFVCCEVDGELLFKSPMFTDCDGKWVSNETVSDISSKVNVSFIGEQLHVTFTDETPFLVELYNLQGMLVAQINNNRNEMYANLNYLPNGVYVVRISSNSFVHSVKIGK